jgi:purine nucleosidase
MGQRLSVVTLAFAALLSLASSGPAVAAPPPVVFDTDMDFDDTAALAYLAALHKKGVIDLRAVTITGAGVGYPGRGIYHARCLLQRVGLPNIPVADSKVAGPNVPSPALRLGVEVVLDTVFAGCLQSAKPSVQSAPELLASVLAATQGQATLIATGPLTDVAAALRLFNALPAHGQPLSHAYFMGGAVAVPGGLPFIKGYDGSQELNFWSDPPSDQYVLDTLGSRVSLIPVDATNYVPVTRKFSTQLLFDAHTPEARIVALIANHPVVQVGVLEKSAYWWDPLAAVAATQANIVSYAGGRVAVVQSGVSEGAIVSSVSGPLIEFGVAADQGAFEQRFIDGLNER